MDNLMKVADAFPSRHIDVFVLFSKAGEFTQSELSCLRGASKRFQHHIILLSRTELEPYNIYQFRDRELGKYHHPISRLEDLASATKKIYFQ